MLLLPKGQYVFRQERLALDKEILSVNGQVVIMSARPARVNGQEGVKLEMLVEKNAIIKIKKWGEEQ
jgi:hypothetical protein